MSERHPAGTWVEIRLVLLNAGERARQVPADTAQVPLVMRGKGYLLAPAAMGETAEVRTVTGRRLAGELVSVNPAYEHGFGTPLPELQAIGAELRLLLDEPGSTS